MSNFHNRMLWETIDEQPHSDPIPDDRIPAGAETDALRLTSSGAIQQGYDSMAPLTGHDLFGNLAGSADGKSIQKSSHDPLTQPFLSIPMDEPSRLNRNSSSDSEAAPQEFHLEEGFYHVSA